MNDAMSNISLEVVAAVTAALAAVMDQPVGSFAITSIRPEAQRPTSVWAKAGVLEAQLTRRQFGLRTR